MSVVPSVAALFTQRNSFYEFITGVDCYDIRRDALTFPGGLPVVAHPPCRLWSRMRGLSTVAEADREREKDLGRWSVSQVRQWGGVVEQPASSLLWQDQGLPLPGRGFDETGGFSMCIWQNWFGARVKKPTWLYINGIDSREIPVYPISLDAIHYLVGRGAGRLKEVPKWERSYTVPVLAVWLVEIALICGVNKLTHL